MAKRILRIFNCLFLLSFSFCASSDDARSPPTTPVIYSTDLSHPHDDPDDHFDLICLYSLKELDVRGIILDQGKRQEHSPGRIPVEQVNQLTGRSVPFATGLFSPLKSPEDPGGDQDIKYQGGVDLIIKILQESKIAVTIITVGSLRDIAAAFNRRPALFRKKVSRLMLFIGEASTGTREWNVGLDTNAFIRIMNSGLPIWWIPCFDGGNFKNNGRASYWTVEQTDLLRNAPRGVMNYFIYALQKKIHPGHLEYLNSKVDPEEEALVLSGKRRLWGAGVFIAAAGRVIVERAGEFLPLKQDEIEETYQRVEAFRFLPISLFVDEDAKVVYEESAGSHLVNRFEISYPERYAEIMSSVTHFLIENIVLMEQ